MNNSGHFTSRSDTIEWINDLVITNLTKIEQLGAGNIYCQLLDAAFPHHVPLAKVKWHAYLEVDFLHNFKILQTCFEQIGINKLFNAQKLAKAKYQDNWQFIQWFRSQLGPKIVSNGVYNALARRNNQKINLLFTNTKHFDLRQTMTKSKQLKQNKQNIKVQKYKERISQKKSKIEQNSIMKTNRNILGLKVLNNYSNQMNVKKGQSSFKSNISNIIDKQNIKMLATLNSCDSKNMKKKKLTVTTKSKPFHLKPVVPLHSEEQECF